MNNMFKTGFTSRRFLRSKAAGGSSTDKNSAGFTLIELLVVVAVIGLLSSIVLVSIKGVRAKARDSRRIQEIRQIQLALELYRDKIGHYPANTDDDTASGTGGWDYGNVLLGASDTFIKPLIDEGFFSAMPIETFLSDNTYYRYYLATNVDLGPVCGGRRTFYSLGVKLENPHSDYGLNDQINSDCYPGWGWWTSNNVYGIVGYE